MLTLAGGRDRHLTNMIAALARSDLLPAELVISPLGATPQSKVDAPFPVRVLPPLPQHAGARPLAAARNQAAAAAAGSMLLFLDVDCLPSATALGAVSNALARHDALLCPEVRYLGAPVPDDWTEAALLDRAVPHPARSFPAAGVRAQPNAGLLWSLALAARAGTVRRLSGFDAGYTGYGAEDTDLGFTARAAGIPLLFLGGAPVFHQCHAVYDPPLQHFHDIVRNARRFFGKWGVWPMDGWLAAFAALGLIAWQKAATTLDLVRAPTDAEIAAARQPDGTPF